MVPTSVRLLPSVDERLSKLARLTGRSKSFYIAQANENELERFEYIYSLRQQVEDYRAGKLETYSLDEVGEMLGLDD